MSASEFTKELGQLLRKHKLAFFGCGIDRKPDGNFTAFEFQFAEENGGVSVREAIASVIGLNKVAVELGTHIIERSGSVPL